MKKVQLTTDGSCLGNPGPGGWACILRLGTHAREMRGGAAQTTNNRMELTAAIEGLQALREPCHVTVVTDSQYLRRGMTEFVPRWRQNGWRNSRREPVVNRDLWETLASLAEQHETEWVWLQGHNGHADHQRCDSLAHQSARTEAEKN